MPTMFRLSIAVAALALVTLAGGCGRSSSKAGLAETAPAQQADAAAEHQAKVAAIAARHIAGAAGEKGRIERRKPYYFKEYAEYPEAPEAARVVLGNRDSQAAPLTAAVEVPKTRYATDLHRDQKEARKDDTYFRSVGTETIGFELRSGSWVRVGSTFVADSTEELVDGQWVARQEPIEVEVYEPEDERGWFRRFWSGLTGRY